MAPNEKQQNVVNMIKRFGQILQRIPDGKLKEDFNAFVFQLTFGNKELVEMLEWTQKKIDEASTVLHQDLQANAKATKQFWENIQKDIVDTYNANKEG